MQKEEQPNEKPAPELIVFTPPPTKPPTTTTDNTVFLVDDQRGGLEGFSLDDLNPGARTAILKVKKQTAGSPSQLVQIISLDRNQATGGPIQLVSLQHKNTEKIDGDRTDTPGSCDCGYKHWFQGKEVDFVIKPSGYNVLLGFNLGDNPYKVAEYFVMQNDQSKNLNHRNMINAVATDIIRRTDRFFPNTETEKKEKKSTFDPTKATMSIPNKNTTHWNPTTQQIEKTTYLATDEFSKHTPEEVAENVKKLKILEAQRRQREEEARQRDQDTAHITDLLRRDRIEINADAQQRNEKVAHTAETKNHGSVPFLRDGNLEWGPSSRKTISDTPVKTTGAQGLHTLKDLNHHHHHHHECQDPHHHHPSPGRPLVGYGPEEEENSDSSDDDADDDDEEPIFAEYHGRPPKEVWTADMVIKRLRRDMPPYDNTKQLLMECGFTNSESVQILSHVLLHHHSERRLQKRQRILDQRPSHQTLPDPIEVHPRADDSTQSKTPERKVFQGQGFTLRTWTPETDSTPSSSTPASLLEVDPNAPKTSLKVRFADNTQVTIEANHNHTVQQLTDHIRVLSKVISFKLVNTGSFPPKALTNGSLTIKEANLLNGTIQMSK